MYDPTATNSPHLSGAQPTWGDLPYICELLHKYWTVDNAPEEVTSRLISRGKENKIKQIRTLCSQEKLGLLHKDGSLSPTGIWIAQSFEEPSQQGLQDDLAIGTKDTLSSAEQALFGMILFDRDWLPMLATINLLATERVSTTETEARAQAFEQRISHLKGYQKVNSVNSWKKKAQAHFSWADSLDIAYEDAQASLQLTGFGHRLHKHLQDGYHPDWP